jgi:hypothetical protein
MNLPSELSIGGILIPPMLVAAVFGVAAAAFVAKIAGGSRIVRHIWHPWLAFVGLAVLFTALIGLFLIRAA